jgi:hypothetical protein
MNTQRREWLNGGSAVDRVGVVYDPRPRNSGVMHVVKMSGWGGGNGPKIATGLPKCHQEEPAEYK